MSEIDETENKVITTLEKSTEDNLIRLSSGVVLLGKQANPTTILKVMASFPRPEPPTWTDPTMGRIMPNFNDPDYISRVQAWQFESTNAVIVAFILLGTELVSKPEGMLGPFPEKKIVGSGKNKKEVIGPDFLDDYALLGLPMRPQSEKWRYLTWVQFMACVSEQDSKLIQEVVGRLSGVSKKDVKTAEEFPGSETQDR